MILQQVTPSGKVKAPGSQRYDPNEGKSISLQNQPRRWEVTSNFNSQILTTDSDKARLERERIKKQHYAQALGRRTISVILMTLILELYLYS